MRFQILGSVRVAVDGREVPVTAGRERVLLGVLLLHANQPVTGDQLIDAIWPGRPPRDARNQLQGCVSRLRKRFATAGLGRTIVTEPDGYRAVIDSGDLDLLEFRRLVGQARAAAGEGRYEQAAADFRAALGLWRGPALAGIDGHTIPRAATTLAEERVQALEERLAAELAGGAGGQLVAELTELIGEHPHREGVHRSLMLALYRAGRQADALAAYQRARQLLLDELGIEPGTELRELHQAILNRDPALDALPPARTQTPPPRPRQLPSDVAGFSGRAVALKALDELLARRAGSTGPVVIYAIAGTAGVGKTALAVHWAHRVTERFPDGQLCVNLRGFDAGGPPVEPASVVRGFLDALAVSSQRIPADPDAQVSLYRSLLADRQMLVVLDNACDAEQIRPLLPGAPGCLVLVTSRHQLSGLVATDGAIPIPIDLLPDDEARQLLAARLGHERLISEPAAVAELLAACAGLPLALAIVAARAAARPTFPLAAIAEEVRAAGAGLEPWTGPDPASDLRAVFSWSYHALDPEAARLFRLLGLHPGPDFAAPAAASLAAVPLPKARRQLAQLTEANLLIEHAPGRWTLHDLLRTYAIELAEATDTETDRRAAMRRLFDYYLHVAHTAAVLIDPHRAPPYTPTGSLPDVGPIDLHTHEEGTAWLMSEHLVLFKAIDMSAKTGFDVHTWQMAGCLNVFLENRGRQSQLLSIHHAGLLAARRLGDRSAEAMAHASIGIAHGAIFNHDLSREHSWRALKLRQSLGDTRGQALCHVNLAWCGYREANYRDAMRHSERANELFREVADRAWQGRTLNMLAWCCSILGNHRQAVVHCEQALVLQQEVDDVSEAGFTWDSLGYAYHHLGDYSHAVDCFRRALALFDQRDHPRGRATVLNHLGDAHHRAGHLDAARSSWQVALELLQLIDHPDADMVRAKLGGAADTS